MQAETLARKPPITASPKTPLREIAKTLAEKKIGLIVLVDERDPTAPVGVISERDIVRALASNADLNAPASQFMTSPVITVEAQEPLWKVADVMRKHNIRHVVVTKGGRLYGVISIRDLIGEESALRSLVEYGEAVEEGAPAGD
ncbi:MAG: CBS domain-containing protein [Thermoproteus sp. AZ2]|jgi:CBS domain-containing protein|uniref:CBS domain-containing protein n=1 Tax=Thermoproteus sp. AZ2 TaxID=1609232 RepID=A0ACC6V1S9_9CREN|nr:MAG: histidine kinase [Thermoproteus sp. AZ2]